MFRKEFVEIITDSGVMTFKELKPLLDQSRDPTTIDEFKLLQFDHFDEQRVGSASAQKIGANFIDLKGAKVPQQVLSILKKSVISKYRIIPMAKGPNGLTLATYDASIVKIKPDLEKALRTKIDFILTTISAWKAIYDSIQESLDEILETIEEIKPETETKEKDIKEEDIGQDVINLVNKILAEAFVKKVSDIHVEPYENRFRIRFRLDGSLVEVMQPARSMMLPVVSRFKIMAQMDIAEKRKPQDGRIKLKIGGRPIDYRVSCLPTLFGEKIVLRLLDQSNLQLDMTKLGLEPKQLEALRVGIFKPFGMVLVTGPTGSGKTTTLYSALTELNTPDNNISTAEDPVEFNLEGINQVNVRKDIGLTFASALKSFLRQDPDIIMVGEIRDLEVGETAVEAALTGHLVLSTLHTNDAPATITRLLNMGIEPFLVTACLNTVVAQRLARKICVHCKEPTPIPLEHLIKAGLSEASASKVQCYKGKGCDKCSGTGYKGRVAVYEVLSVTAAIREGILRNASADEIKKIAIKEGMKTLRMCALTKVAQGITTLEEALSVSASDN